MTVTPEHAVDVINRVYGRHDGYRALHARGVLFKGTFTPAAEARSLTRAAHMQGDPVQATFRFSNGSGNPRHPDFAPDPRGFAVKMYLPDGSRTDIVSVSNPLFPTRTPDGFIALLDAQSSGAAMAWKLPAFFARHPRALVLATKTFPTLLPPRSYATIPYYAIHAFRWVDGDGGKRYVRYTLQPEKTEPRLGLRESRRQDREFLQTEIRERVARGPVRFKLQVQIAEEGDPVDDPTAAWPDRRRRVDVGDFEISAPETEREQGGDVLVFDPTRITDGIELSGDPVLSYRPQAYAESIKRRAGV